MAEVVPETADATSYRFHLPAELAPAFAFSPGQHLTLRALLDGEDVRRNYSLCVAPHEGRLQVTVKRVAGGRFSNWANDNVREGDTLEVQQPQGSFTHAFSPDQAGPYLGFAGGSGITPVLSLLKTALLTEPSSRFTLIYGNRDSSGILFLEELSALKNRFMGRLQVHHFLSREAEDVELFNGRLDRAKCDEVLDGLVDPATVTQAFICGPGPMMDAAEGALLAAGVPRGHVLIERYTADRPSEAQAALIHRAQAAAAGLELAVTLDGRTRRIAFDAAAGNILDSARIAGLPAPYACKAGVCATCRARVTAGTVDMAARYGLSDDEVAAGYVLTCQSIPRGDGVAVDYDA